MPVTPTVDEKVEAPVCPEVPFTWRLPVVVKLPFTVEEELAMYPLVKVWSCAQVLVVVVESAVEKMPVAELYTSG